MSGHPYEGCTFRNEYVGECEKCGGNVIEGIVFKGKEICHPCYDKNRR